MVLLARAPEQRLIGRVLDERVLERVGRLRREAPLHHHLGLHQLRQCRLECRRLQGCDGLQQIIGKRAPHGRAQLRHDFGRAEAVKARHQRVVEGGRDRQRGQGTRQLIARLVLLKEPGLQHGFGQLFHKQGHAIRLADDLLEHCRG